jgi:hypothetical protein
VGVGIGLQISECTRLKVEVENDILLSKGKVGCLAVWQETQRIYSSLIEPNIPLDMSCYKFWGELYQGADVTNEGKG